MAGRDRRFESFVAGLYPGPAHTWYRGGQLGVQIDLTPLGAYRLFGVPGNLLAGQVLDLDDVAPALGGESARDRMASGNGWADRLALVADTLASMAAEGPRCDPMVAWLWHQLEASGGQAGIAGLVAETGRSHRHVVNRFRQQVGLTPKTASRVLRYERAADMLTSGRHGPGGRGGSLRVRGSEPPQPRGGPSCGDDAGGPRPHSRRPTRHAHVRARQSLAIAGHARQYGLTIRRSTPDRPRLKRSWPR